MRIRFIWQLNILLFFTVTLKAQDFATLYGTISDTTGYSVGFASVSIPNTRFSTVADRFGRYELKVPAGEQTVYVSCVGYESYQTRIMVQPGERKKLDFTLQELVEKLDEVKVINRSDNTGTLQRINTRTLGSMPNATGNIESLIKRLPGVASNNELSSQYSVRGGSFDENLIYVNNVEIYRPVLIRSGQQEGLSFVNPDLVGSLKFSAGGFDASYGDKMSSVLDITYKRPTENQGSATLSFLGANLHYEGISKNQRFRHLTGIRYKTTQYLLAGLDTRGEYRPQFFDLQTYLTYDISKKLELSFLGNISQNLYQFIPTEREIDFGTFQLPLRAQIFYEGQEKDNYKTAAGAIGLNFHPNEQNNFKFIVSGYSNNEAETFDLLGEYNIGQIDYNNRDSIQKIGVGGFLNRARNFLDIQIVSTNFLANHTFGKNKLKYGITFQHEAITDRLSEWEIIDSAGYIFPYNDHEINVSNRRKSENQISSNRIMGYVQYTRELQVGEETFFINAGIRSHYWTLNKENILNPRFSLSYKPSWQNRLLLYFSTGYYNQPAFYKELRNEKGELNKQIKAQTSLNYLLGADYLFYAWSHPFKITVEGYYKKMDNLIPYRIDNVRTIYAGMNMARGYAKGIDLKLNGEFVKGTESWLSISVLETREDIKGDYYSLPSKPDTIIYPGYYSRPTDQLLNVNLFFQDYLPRYPSYKVYLSIHYGSALPVTFPLSNRWDDVHKLLPSYKRVDLGFSKIVKSEGEQTPYSVINIFKEIAISAEIFNVIGVNNTASYMWIKTFAAQEGIPGYFAVPNYLTPRRLNIKVVAKF